MHSILDNIGAIVTILVGVAGIVSIGGIANRLSLKAENESLRRRVEDLTAEVAKLTAKVEVQAGFMEKRDRQIDELLTLNATMRVEKTQAERTAEQYADALRQYARGTVAPT